MPTDAPVRSIRLYPSRSGGHLRCVEAPRARGPSGGVPDPGRCRSPGCGEREEEPAGVQFLAGVYVVDVPVLAHRFAVPGQGELVQVAAVPSGEGVVDRLTELVEGVRRGHREDPPRAGPQVTGKAAAEQLHPDRPPAQIPPATPGHGRRPISTTATRVRAKCSRVGPSVASGMTVTGRLSLASTSVNTATCGTGCSPSAGRSSNTGSSLLHVVRLIAPGSAGTATCRSRRACGRGRSGVPAGAWTRRSGARARCEYTPRGHL